MAPFPVNAPGSAVDSFKEHFTSLWTQLDGKSEWKGNGLVTGWCANPAMAVGSLCCSCCVAGLVTQKHGGNFVISCCCAAFCPCHACSHRFPERKAAARNIGLTQDDCNTYVASRTCGPCAMVQELKTMGVSSPGQAAPPGQEKM